MIHCPQPSIWSVTENRSWFCELLLLPSLLFPTLITVDITYQISWLACWLSSIVGRTGKGMYLEAISSLTLVWIVKTNNNWTVPQKPKGACSLSIYQSVQPIYLSDCCYLTASFCGPTVPPVLLLFANHLNSLKAEMRNPGFIRQIQCMQ